MTRYKALEAKNIQEEVLKRSKQDYTTIQSGHLGVKAPEPLDVNNQIKNIIILGDH